MNAKLKTFLIWFFAFLFTAAVAVYQRMTGPTYPIRGKIELGSQLIKYQLLTSFGDKTDAPIFIEVPDRSITGEINYRRYKSDDSLSNVAMKRVGDYLVTFIPHQPPAGKVTYQITLIKDNQAFELTKKEVSIRFKGATPALVLIPHIFFIFLAMLFSTITGIEAIFKRSHLLLYTWLTVITLLLGGLILGPIVQKFSFGYYWTGWPFGHDLTDNKSLIAFIFWIIALIAQYRYRGKRAWAILAAFVLLVVFLIPHSVLGSEIDYTKEQKTEAHGN
jgi:hypothetical protein